MVTNLCHNLANQPTTFLEGVRTNLLFSAFYGIQMIFLWV